MHADLSYSARTGGPLAPRLLLGGFRWPTGGFKGSFFIFIFFKNVFYKKKHIFGFTFYRKKKKKWGLKPTSWPTKPTQKQPRSEWAARAGTV